MLQRLVGVLAVQVHQPLAERGELRERHRLAVDESARAALRIEHATHQHLALVAGQRVLREPGAYAGCVGHVERGGQLRPLGARTNLANLETVAEQQPERVEQDRLACAGLAGQHGESGIELDIERVDEHEVADRQQAQHLWRGGRSAGGAAADQAAGPALPRRRSGVSLQCSFSRSIAK